MNRRKFSQFIVGLSFLPLAGCGFNDENKSSFSNSEEVVRALSEHNFYGVEILKMLNPGLSVNKQTVKQLESEYSQLFRAKNKGELILRVNDLIQNDFMLNDFVMIKKHMFSRLEVLIYNLSLT